MDRYPLPREMRAVVYRTAVGLQVEILPVPEAGPDGVLIKVANTGFCGSDHSLIKSGGLADGIILGHEVSGTVVACGSKVAGILPGQRVIVRPNACGACRDCRQGRPYFCQSGRRTIGIGDMPGAFAEYVRVLPQMLIAVPDGVDSRNAALAEAFAAALHGIRCLGREGGSALVLGGGPIGLALVRLLHLMGFDPIALAEPQAAKRQLGQSLGAGHVMDPLAPDMGARVFEATQGIGFEAVFECSGVAANVGRALEWVARGGDICIVSMIFAPATLTPLTLNFKEARLTACYSNTHEENRECLSWMAAGRLDGRILISDLIPLEHLPAVYHARIDAGLAVKVMLQIGDEF
jgi:(R,R)-butanediol dehydrogenase/meso-butanediol dehydrogenase/diacetyl reductase